jgi:mono/diheme cytochrome c family protein
VRRFLLVLGLGLAGCVANVPVPTPLMAGGDEARLAELRAGRELYVNKCSGCHALLDVDRFSDREWAAEVGEMFRKKKVRMTPEERDRLILYLTTVNGRD